MLESTLVTLGWQVSNYLVAGQRPKPMGNENITAAPSGTFRTGDGLLNIAANRQTQFTTLCRLVGRSDLMVDPRFAGREERKRNRTALKAELEAALATDTAEAWELRLNAAGVPAGRVLTVPDVLAHEQVTSRGLVKQFADVPGAGRDVAVVRAGFRLEDGDPEPCTPPPVLGQDTEAVLGDLGLSGEDIAGLAERKVI